MFTTEELARELMAGDLHGVAAQAAARLLEQEQEITEQCRLSGMGAQREAALLSEVERLKDYDTRLTAVMPADYKDWHENHRHEWPEVAASVILNMRDQRDEAARDIARVMDERDAALVELERLREEQPPWWHAVKNILSEYGLQAVDFVADFKAATLTDEEIDAIPFTGYTPASERGHSEAEALRLFARAVLAKSARRGSV